VNDPRLTLSAVADLVGGRVRGDETLEVRGVAPLEEAGPTDLGLLADRRYLGRLPESGAGALLVSDDLVDAVPGDRSCVAVPDAHAALVPLLHRLYPRPAPEPGVHPTAVLGRGVEMGVDVVVGPYAVIEDGVSVGDRCTVGAHAVLGRDSRVGEGTVLHPHVVLYPRTLIGRRVIVHAGVRLGSDGFGYAVVDGALVKVPQVGRCVVEDDVEIGAGTCIDRGSIGETRVGAGTKLDNLVHVGHNVRLGPGCALAAQSGISGSVTIGAGVMMGGQAGLAGHLRIGNGVRVAGQSGVAGNLADGETVMGTPARDLKTFLRAYASLFRERNLGRRVRDLERGVSEAEGER
jgi:UDP-3-O-[3-hydroxymyristoyl] glucosamine N-acyltransferase